MKSLFALIDAVFQIFSGDELGDFLGGDIDGLFGLGIDAFASSAFDSREGAKANELNLFALHVVAQILAAWRQPLAARVSAYLGFGE